MRFRCPGRQGRRRASQNGRVDVRPIERGGWPTLSWCEKGLSGCSILRVLKGAGLDLTLVLFGPSLPTQSEYYPYRPGAPSVPRKGGIASRILRNCPCDSKGPPRTARL